MEKAAEEEAAAGHKEIAKELKSGDPDAGLDHLLDSKEFKTPISDAEVRSYFKGAKNESLEYADDFDEESFDEEVNGFLNEVYENADRFETTSCDIKEGKLFVEGKITFKSGKTKNTLFEFKPSETVHGLMFGLNEDFSKSKGAFRLRYSIDDSKKLVAERLNYQFKINENLVKGSINKTAQKKSA